MSDKIDVLIADDSPDIREMLSLRLSFDPRFKVVGQAGDGEEAVRLVEERVPHLLLLDLGMPAMDGLEVLSVVRSKYPEMKVAILSGFPAKQLQSHALSIGADIYLEKMDSLASLCDRLYEVVTG